MSICKNKHDDMKPVNLFNKENKICINDNYKIKILDKFLFLSLI